MLTDAAKRAVEVALVVHMSRLGYQPPSPFQPPPCPSSLSGPAQPEPRSRDKKRLKLNPQLRSPAAPPEPPTPTGSARTSEPSATNLTLLRPDADGARRVQAAGGGGALSIAHGEGVVGTVVQFIKSPTVTAREFLYSLQQATGLKVWNMEGTERWGGE